MLNQSVKNTLLNILKIGVAIGLVTWLVNSGKLNFAQLKVITQSWKNLFITLGVWAFAVVGLSSWRWQILLSGIGIRISYFRALQLTLIGLFFNSTIPGAVGGDIVKAVYVIRDMPNGGKTPAMLTILLDRVVGMMGLFVMGGVMILTNPNYFVNNDTLKPLAALVLAVCLGTLAFFSVIFRKATPTVKTLDRILNIDLAPMAFLRKIFTELRVYKDNPFSLVKALGLSIFIQTILACYFMHITREMNGWVVSFDIYATIYPLGILVTALPLAPAGIGVGHVAFDKFYHLVGMENGANVFNVYVLASIVMNLTGLVPYLFVRKKISPNLE